MALRTRCFEPEAPSLRSAGLHAPACRIAAASMPTLNTRLRPLCCALIAGFVCAPAPEALASAIDRLMADPELAPRLGSAGCRRAQAVTWDGVVEQLLG